MQSAPHKKKLLHATKLSEFEWLASIPFVLIHLAVFGAIWSGVSTCSTAMPRRDKSRITLRAIVGSSSTITTRPGSPRGSLTSPHRIIPRSRARGIVR